jgi:prepilin-type N-terminal cleavage/methylation domain-containing protein
MKNGLNKNNNFIKQGFSILEVLIATTIFAFFATAYVVSDGHNKASSTAIKEELILQQLADEVIQLIKLDPPKFDDALTLAPETKTFEQEGMEQYQYTVTYAKLEIPNLAQIQGKGAEDQEEPESNQSSGLENRVFDEIKKYIEDRIWQVKVEVKNKDSGFLYSLSTWLTNEKAKPKIKF